MNDPHEVLIREVLDPRQPKCDREWAAAKEIERLRDELAKAERRIEELGTANNAEKQRAEQAEALAAGYLADLERVKDKAYWARRASQGHNCAGTSGCQSIHDLIDSTLSTTAPQVSAIQRVIEAAVALRYELRFNEELTEVECEFIEAVKDMEASK